VPEHVVMTMGDIYYALFRHKWKIVVCSFAGLAAAAAFYIVRPPPFQSEARLFIRYVMESQGMGQVGDDNRIKSPDQRGETIINSEIDILTSRDLAEQVAKVIGPEKIVARPDGINDLNMAALLIQRDLLVEVARNSSVIRIAFSHPNPEIVQPVLTELIDRYLKRHVEIHRASGMVGGFLAAETDQLRSRLAQTEEELRKARNKAGVISLTDAKKTYADQIARLRQEIFTAEVELAERSSMLQSMTKQSPVKLPPDGQTSTEPSSEQIKQYRSLSARQDALQKREQDLLTYFREDNPRVKDIHTQLTEVEGLKKNLEEAYPKLARIIMPVSIQTGTPAGPIDLATEAARLTSLQTKIKVLNTQLEAIRAEAANTDQMEVTILQLMRQKELEEANYKNYSASLEQARINEALGSGSVSNISQVQTPTPPFADKKKALQIMIGLALAGIMAGLAWAFAIELYLDRSVRRPIDVERMLRLPLFLSIPNLTSKELGSGPAAMALPQSDAGSKLSGTELSPWDSEKALYPFHETLRDRLIGYFESKGLTHKPKLVAVTGIGHNGGVTTTAAGLASSLSETGDGNVLLVDMTIGQGSAQQFYQGKAVCGLEEILETRDSAQIEGNLYVVGQEPGGEKLSRILPNRFNKLVPKLKASNFDYIIFDMPPVSQVSITPRLAGFMDMVLLVIESEKTDRDLVQRATALLAESKAHVGAVLNKTKTYVPPRLHQDNLGNS
jgi:uncharacterized protein involved in exopolysaccharide biosynthesis/Mrp family chromosome partitioning ATPase